MKPKEKASLAFSQSLNLVLRAFSLTWEQNSLGTRLAKSSSINPSSSLILTISAFSEETSLRSLRIFPVASLLLTINTTHAMFMYLLASLFQYQGCKDERPDCDYIVKATGGGEKLQQYCNQWKDDAAVKQCRGTCRMCEC